MKKYMNVYVITRVIGVVILALLLLEGSRLYVDFRNGKFLREAIKANNYNAVEWYLKMGVSPNIYVTEDDSEVKVPVMYYAVLGSRNIHGIELLVRYGADFKMYGAWGGKMIRHPIMSHNIEIVEYLLEKGVLLQNSDRFLNALLDEFAGTEQSDEKLMLIVNRAMERGLDINYYDDMYPKRPLEIAEDRDCHVLEAKLRELGAK